MPPIEYLHIPLIPDRETDCYPLTPNTERDSRSIREETAVRPSPQHDFKPVPPNCAYTNRVSVTGEYKNAKKSYLRVSEREKS